ncbi:haloacid dehalogenase [Mycobacterium saskatchewanense]|uniref:phosphoserine phosphatase n=2 Tax=Mycobacterium saskatchewanense TaxID=220927 RepID=A0AAJ3TUC9_9MYCO|nr:haloacid dehalogenase [Mycobacterium saskatchewanense]
MDILQPRQSIPPLGVGRLLHVFDMDGTLMMGAATVELCRHMGRLADAITLEQEWVGGEVGEITFWERALQLWEGVTEEQVDQAFEDAMWMEGLREVFDDIDQRGERSIVISQSPHFFVRRLERWGVHATFGSDIRLGERVTADSTLQAEDKLLITQHVLAQWGLSPRQCVAYGDSSSDVALFQWLPNTVAVNARAPLTDLAAKSYTGEDLRKVYLLGRSLIDQDTL